MARDLGPSETARASSCGHESIEIGPDVVTIKVDVQKSWMKRRVDGDTMLQPVSDEQWARLSPQEQAAHYAHLQWQQQMAFQHEQLRLQQQAIEQQWTNSDRLRDTLVNVFVIVPLVIFVAVVILVKLAGS